MKFEWYLARRYFKSNKKGSGFLSFIKYMSIGGVTVGAAGLLIALSIVHGFKSTINNKIMGFAPHLTVNTYTGTPIFRADTVLSHLSQYPEIVSAQIIVQGQVMIQTRDGISGTVLKGIDDEASSSGISDFITEGAFQLAPDSSGMPGIVVGRSLASQLGAEIGSVITVYTIEGIPSLLNSPEIQQFRLTAIYETGIDQFDEIFALAERPYARKLFGLHGTRGHSVEIRLQDSNQIYAFKEKLDSTLGMPYFNETIYMVFGNIFAWVDLQENMIPLVISGMIIVAAFNLIGTILMMVLERTKDIGVLKTLGGKAKAIRRIFLIEGLMVAATGLIIGIGISLLFYFLQVNYQIIPLSQENYYMSYAPVEPHLFDFIIVSTVTFVLCGLASWLPARVAAKTDPVKVISFGA